MARMAAIMASTYKAYLGVGLGPLSVSIFMVFTIHGNHSCLFISNSIPNLVSAVLDKV